MCLRGVKPVHEREKAPRLKLLAVIVDDESADNVAELFRDQHIYLHYRLRASGTASSEILDVLGLGRSDKVVEMCLGTQHTVRALLKKVAQKLRLLSPGRGIAFALPLSGVSNAVFRFLSGEELEQAGKQTESEVSGMTGKINFDLVLAVINRGYSDELMEAARQAGATGGTVVNAHRITTDQPLKFWGVSLQEERELVAIVSRRENKADIMRAISQKCGIGTEAQGLVLALPVDGVAGLEMLED